MSRLSRHSMHFALILRWNAELYCEAYALLCSPCATFVLNNACKENRINFLSPATEESLSLRGLRNTLALVSVARLDRV